MEASRSVHNAHRIHRFKTKYYVEKKNVVFRVISELTENLVGVRRSIIYTLLSEQFSTHVGVRCVVTRSISKPTDTITKEYRQ